MEPIEQSVEKTYLEKATELPTGVPVPGNDPVDAVQPPTSTDPKPDLDADTASKLSKMFSSEEGKVFLAKLDEWKKSWSQPPEVYMHAEHQPKFDSGVRHCIQLIGFLKQDADIAVELYAKSSGTSIEAPSV